MGRVYLVGAGPGDPELLTVKALRLMQSADVIVHDRLVSKEILSLISSQTRRVYVGKASGRHHCSQQQINELLATLAMTNEKVVRLKGGDPYVFGRGGEEARYLISRGISVRVVPGLTAAAAGGYAGIPLTYRGMANAVTFVTGHCRDNGPLELDWTNLANDKTTLVIYMGLSHIQEISARLIQAGRDPKTPVIMIENGTTVRQRQHVTILAELPTDHVAATFRPPTLIVIGRVVELAGELGEWREFDDHIDQRGVACA